MTKEDKIKILKENIVTKTDIPKALEKLNCKIGVEIGVRKAGNLGNLAKNKKFKEGILYGIDCWSEDEEKPEINDEGFTVDELNEQWFGCITKFSSNPFVKIVRNFSHEASLEFKDEYFDFIYIDAAHDYDSVVEDLEVWWPKLKKGGIFSGHDYFEDHRIWRGKKVGVYQAVQEFIKKYNVNVDHVTNTESEGGKGISCNSFFIIK